MWTYHVTRVNPKKPHEESKKILNLESKRDYKDAILSLFQLPQGGKYMIQKFVKDFDDWIDIDSCEELPPSGNKLKITVCSGGRQLRQAATKRPSCPREPHRADTAPVPCTSSRCDGKRRNASHTRQLQATSSSIETETESASGGEPSRRLPLTITNKIRVQAQVSGASTPATRSHQPPPQPPPPSSSSTKRRRVESKQSYDSPQSNRRERIVRKIPLNSSVCGLTMVGQRLYVLLHGDEDQIRVFSTVNYHPLHCFSVPAKADDLRDMASCATRNCLYISDWSQRLVYKRHLSSSRTDSTESWKLEESPNGLSVTATNCHLIVTCRDAGLLLELSPNRKTLRAIHLETSITYPLHALQVESDVFIVSHGDHYADNHRVCKLRVTENRGTVSASFGGKQGSGEHQLNEPCHVASLGTDGKLLVADFRNGRVVLLNRSMHFLRNMYSELGKWPQRLFVDYVEQRLYIGHFDSGITVLQF